MATGFSYVENKTLVVKTDEEAATDLTTLLKKLFNGNANLQKSPLYIFAESYGGKFAVTLALSALKAIEAGELKLQLGGNNYPFHKNWLALRNVQTDKVFFQNWLKEILLIQSIKLTSIPTCIFNQNVKLLPNRGLFVH